MWGVGRARVCVCVEVGGVAGGKNKYQWGKEEREGGEDWEEKKKEGEWLVGMGKNNLHISVVVGGGVAG